LQLLTDFYHNYYGNEMIVSSIGRLEETDARMLRRLLMLNFPSGDGLYRNRAERLRARCGVPGPR